MNSDNIPRPRYLDHIVSLLNRNMMLVLVGQRRVGKSYLLEQVEDWLKNNRENANVVYINKELQGFRHITNGEELYDDVSPQLPEGGDNYLLIDEVQDIERFEDALRSLHAERRCQIIATGSNAYIFSSELSTRLGGRYIEIPVYSLDYTEFLRFHKLDDNDESLRHFLRIGGLPGLNMFSVEDTTHVIEYLGSVYNTVLLKDIIIREEIRNVPLMESLLVFLADILGKIVSPSSIAGTMISQGEKVNGTLISTYLKYICNALLIDQVRRYDIHGKRILEQNSKYYFTDHGIRNFLCGMNVFGSIEKIMENVVYNHLKIEGFEVTVGILRNGEIDFVATKEGRKIYVQVTYMLNSKETIDRELGNLAGIKDNYPKYVVSMDPFGGEANEYPGISVIPLREFLKKEL